MRPNFSIWEQDFAKLGSAWSLIRANNELKFDCEADYRGGCVPHSWRWWVVALLSSKIAIGPLAAGRNKTISTLEGTQKDLEGLLKNSEDEDYTETWSRPLKNHLNTIKNPKAGVLKPWAKSISFPLLKMTQKTIHRNCKLNFFKFFSTW